MNTPILEVKDLCKSFKTKKGVLQAVDHVSFTLDRGRTLGVVGESGCGKSTLGRTILRLVEPTSGQVLFDGRDIAGLSRPALRKCRRDIQMIFQDPFASLDPRKTVSQIISEPLLIHKLVRRGPECEKRVLELMDIVGLAHRWYNTYPHQLDGGRRQRIGIARALAVDPKLMICDEPVSALDVSIQAQILNLLKDLQEERNLTCIFITHDLSVVHHFSDEIAVMYLGHVVEKAPAEELFQRPLHPYTRALLSAIPVPDIHTKKEEIILEGELPSPLDPPKGCLFSTRCPHAADRCRAEAPRLTELQDPDGAVRSVACFLHQERN